MIYNLIILFKFNQVTPLFNKNVIQDRKLEHKVVTIDKKWINISRKFILIYQKWNSKRY